MKTARSLPTPTRGLRGLTRPSPNRPSRLPCLRPQVHPRPQQQCRTFLRGAAQPTGRAVENLNVERLHKEAYGYRVRRRNFLLFGLTVSLSIFGYSTYMLVVAMRKPKKLDAGGLPPDKLDPFTDEAGTKRKTVIHDADGRELVPTGDSTVPTFPRVLSVDPSSSSSSPASASTLPQASYRPSQGQERINGVEYMLVGLGTRTVSMFGIRVYVVGFYVATQDIAAIQARLVREINPIASTLIPSEKEELRRALLDPARGEQLWADILASVRPRSLFRIVPVRDTNFHHLRDGFVRAIQARTSSPSPPSGGKDEFGDEAFGAAMRDFKTMFNRGNVPKNGELLLFRDGAGELVVAYDDGKKKKKGEEREEEKKSDGGSGSGTIGRVADERISRLLWLNYLAGSKVASEPARKNIVEGIMEFVERPIGTVATQVL
ncbi:hypothetical protein SLS62_011000 [Diatrype stigma]|uniref:Chalcone isomerase domain-containing protein n=1 Tax=Diatrype stigma TaxID=117547 RepID=A0AAN9U6B0_9PEZI